MNTIAHAIDVFLLVLFAATIALIFYKVLHLWAPRLVGRGSLAEHLAVKDQAQLDERMESLEAGMTLLAVIAAAAPFIGLAGTVMHIIEALRNLAHSGMDISVISGPIATALNATLVGLASAVPAVIAYNLMTRRLQLLENRAARKLAQ